MTDMYCPRCGKAEQVAETYCRQCGIFLPDLSKPAKREIPAEEHLKANTVLNLLTIITSFTLATVLYTFVAFRSDTHALVYVTAGFLLAIGGWHIQTLIRTLKLKKQWKRRTPLAEVEASWQGTAPPLKAASTGKLLDEADFTGMAQASVTEETTRQLVETPRK